MGTYFDKKKLLEENSDLYISPYDKNLDIGSLSQIIDAKKAYKSAEAANDRNAMHKANEKANSVRKSAGRYDGGDDGSEYNRAYMEYEINRPGKYKSEYRDEIDDVMSDIRNIDDFDYNPEDDPLYQNYKKIYMMLGNDAYDRALSQNALRTGGMVSTSAQSAAMQAKNKYNSMLASEIPKLYELAYDEYRDGVKDMYSRLDALTGLDEDEYGRYRDGVKDFEADRDYFYRADSDFIGNLYDMYKYNSDLEYRENRDAVEDERDIRDFNYQSTRDTVNDEKDNRQFNYKVQKDARDFNYRASQDTIDNEYRKERDAVKDDQWQQNFDYKKMKDEDTMSLNELKAAITLAKAMTGRYPVGGYGVIDSILDKIRN